MQKKVTGIGGIFFKAADPAATREWYKKHLGIDAAQHGAMFTWKQEEGEPAGYTLWSPFSATTTYLQPSEKDFMINFRVADLEWLVGELKNEGIELVGEMQVHDYGKFAHIMDPNGIKLELWEPKD